MWIVTREHNLYDQEGEYFVSAFSEKPNFQDLRELLQTASEAVVGRLTRGGGRHNYEDTWYNLHEVNPGRYF